jgi:hypothetical protein
MMMATTSAEPAGYCPHCGYRINPGRCPECGKLVEPQRLATLPPQLRLRRTMRRLRIPAVLLLLFVGLYGVYRYANWRRWMPNDIVLMFLDDRYGVWYREIERRYLAGDFSEEQTERIFRGAIQTSFHNKTPNPYPVGIERTLRVTTRSSFPVYSWGFLNRGWTVWRDEWTVRVDGETIMVLEAPDEPIPDRGVEIDIRGLTPAPHRITVSGHAWLKRSRSPDAAVPYVWPVSLSRMVRIEDRPVSEFVRPIRSSKLINDIEQRVTALGQAPSVDHPGGHLRVNAGLGLVPVAAEIWVRRSGSGPFHRLSRASSTYNPILDVSRSTLPPEAVWFDTVTGMQFEHPIRTLVPATHIDVRLVPSAKIALAAGMKEYADYVIEWIGLPLDPNYGEWHAPSSVRPYED